MEHTERDTGTMNVLLERLTKERLPRLTEIKARVDHGELLTDPDIDFLQRAMRDANENAHIYMGFPEYQDIAGKVAAIYRDIMAQALENEKNRQT